MNKNHFDKNYLKWKSWGDSSTEKVFGQTSVYQADYFGKMMHLCGVAKNSKILEIGFGNGAFLAYCKAHGYNIVGAEVNQDLLRVAGSAGYFVHGGNYLTEAKSSAFDFIFAFDVIEHIHPDEAVDFLTSCRRILSHNGIAIFRFPNGDSPLAMPNFNADITHVNWIGSGKIEYYSQAAGFRSFEVLGTPELIVTRSLLHAFYHCIVLPVKAIINLLLRILFYPGRRINFVAVDLVAILKK